MKNKTVIILGPTASGKTKLAVALAKHIKGEIISADSRQVYKGMDIGSGKDLKEYEDVPFHLIDHKMAGDKYHVQEFMADAQQAIHDIESRSSKAIVCGGTGLYIQGLIQGMPFNQIPQDLDFRASLTNKSFVELQEQAAHCVLPPTYQADLTTHKRCIRVLEIARWWRHASLTQKNQILHQEEEREQNFLVFGIDIPVTTRRQKITDRLQLRIQEGLLEEVKSLLQEGITHEQLSYYGLEYKYCSELIQGFLTQQTFFDKLNTEIHRFAKRQMTYFRKMEKDGIKIHWIPFNEDGPEQQVQAILSIISKNQHS